ncbi:MAG: sensor histidine kinase [Bacteroidia bacterium]
MKNLFKTPDFPLSVNQEINRNNIQRIFYISIPVCFIHALHIYSFRPTEELVSNNVLLWKQGIFLSHIIGFFASLIFGIVAYSIVKKGNKPGLISQILQHAIVFVYLLLSVTIVAIDQRISANNTPYLLVSIAVPVISLLPPFASILYHFITFIYYYYAMGMMQNNEDLLLSLRVNGITFATIAVMVNFLVWKFTRLSIFQKELINNQKIELEKANETKDKFFSIIAHDLKGPIGNINKGLEMIDEEEDELDEEDKKNLIKHIKTSAKSTFDLLDNLLKWAMMQKGELAFQIVKCDFNSILNECIQLLKGTAINKNIEIVFEKVSPIQILADESSVKTICRNIISNAIKYSNPNSSIFISLATNNNYAELVIKDMGIGMDENKTANLFSLVKNTSMPGTSGEKGTGLGLIICKEFIEKNHGSIQVKSETGKGSSFIIHLPLAEVEGTLPAIK